MASGFHRLQQLTMFNMLRSLDQYQLNQLNQMLYANQAVVPEATPVPGFESKPQHTQFTTQQQNIPLAAAARKPFMNDLCDLDDLSVSCLFDGPDADNLPDPDRMFRCIEEEEFASAITQVPVKEEAVSPRPWTSEDCSVMYEGSPQSPCMSDAGTSIYSSDDGFHSDSNSSVDELFDADVGGSPPSFCDEGVCVEPCKSAVVKEEPLPKTAPVKPVTRRRRGPKPPAMYSGTGPIQLWQFLLVLLTSTEHKGLIRWTQEEDFEFKILKPTTVATMWGKKKNKPTMNYEKLSRGLRYYYGKSIIEKVHGKRYVYQFICDIPKILGYNPMDNKPDEFAEDSVCGEPELSPEVEDLEVTSSGYTSLLVAQSFDLSELLKL